MLSCHYIAISWQMRNRHLVISSTKWVISGVFGEIRFSKVVGRERSRCCFQKLSLFSKSKQIFTGKKRHDFLFRSTNLFSPKKSLQNNDPFQHAASYERLYCDFCSLLFLRVGSVDLWKVSPRATSPVFAPARRKSRSWTDRRRPSLPSFCHPFAISAFSAISALSAISLPSLCHLFILHHICIPYHPLPILMFNVIEIPCHPSPS